MLSPASRRPEAAISLNANHAWCPVVICYLNGQFLSRSAAAIPVEDRGFMFGDGVYDVWRVVNGRLFEMDRHLERLAYGLRELRITPPDVARADALGAAAERLLAEDGLLEGEAEGAEQPDRDSGRLCLVAEQRRLQLRQRGRPLVGAAQPRPGDIIGDARVAQINMLTLDHRLLSAGESEAAHEGDRALLDAGFDQGRLHYSAACGSAPAP